MSGIIGLNFVAARTVGASAVLAIEHLQFNNTARSTVLTPTSGKKVRVISASTDWDSASGNCSEVYFGTGANITSTPANAIYEQRSHLEGNASHFNSWPDGGGPIGAVDAVVSIRNTIAASGGARLVLVYREE